MNGGERKVKANNAALNLNIRYFSLKNSTLHYFNKLSRPHVAAVDTH